MRKFCIIMSIVFLILPLTVNAEVRSFLYPPAGTDIYLFTDDVKLEVIETYEKGLWIEGRAEKLKQRGVFVKEYPEWDIIRTNSPFSISSRKSLRQIKKRGLYLIHFKGPLKAEWIKAVNALPELTIIQSFPHFSMIALTMAGEGDTPY